MPLLVYKSSNPANPQLVQWKWTLKDEDFRDLESSGREGGFPTLAELIANVRLSWPDEPIYGIGGDEPEREGLDIGPEIDS